MFGFSVFFRSYRFSVFVFILCVEMSYLISVSGCSAKTIGVGSQFRLTFTPGISISVITAMVRAVADSRILRYSFHATDIRGH